MKFSYLEQVNSPGDLKALTIKEVKQLAQEIRVFLIQSIAQTGGHLASNLGVVELTLAIHHVFRSPADKILWDVGHQCYVHKILTGRREQFPTLRKEGGLSGYPKSAESIHDIFVAGHSSNAISAGYGITQALSLQGKDNYVISVVGDGSFTGGMIYEALNNAGRQNSNLIVILNHNDMSISKNVGAIAKYLTGIRAKPAYLALKNNTKNVLRKTPWIGRALLRSVQRSKILLKGALYQSTWFEEMGFEYLGPVDGHNLEQLIRTLRMAKRQNRPVFVHVDTVKGKGYHYAEQSPNVYHGISQFNIESGNPDVPSGNSYSSMFGKTLCELAAQDDKICAVTAAMTDGTGLQHFAAQYKQRFFDVGIAEQHAVTFCAGLASQGMRPVFAVYSTFLQRGYDQVIHDCAIERQHVVFAIDRAGVVGDDGETHQGLFDVSFLGAVPGVTIYAPESYQELSTCLSRAVYRTAGVVAVRYPRGAEKLKHDLFTRQEEDYLYQHSDNDTLLVTYGRLTGQAMEAVKRVGHVAVLKLIRIAPLPDEVLCIAARYSRILFYEEGIKKGGIGETMLCALYQKGYCGEFIIRAVGATFVAAGTIPSVWKNLKLDADAMIRDIQREQAEV